MRNILVYFLVVIAGIQPLFGRVERAGGGNRVAVQNHNNTNVNRNNNANVNRNYNQNVNVNRDVNVNRNVNVNVNNNVNVHGRIRAAFWPSISRGTPFGIEVRYLKVPSSPGTKQHRLYLP